MDPLEEQSMEVEALESIFMDDFELLKRREDETPLAFQVHLYPHAEGEDDTNHVAATLHVQYSDRYPEEPPAQLKVQSKKALLETQTRELQEIADKGVEDNLMMGAMIFNITESIKEWLLDNNRPPGDGSMHSEMKRRQLEEERKKEKEKEQEELNRAAQEEARERRQKRHGNYDQSDDQSNNKHGTPVTVETFAAWRAAFEEEQHKLPMEERAPSVPDKEDDRDLKSSVTGKQYFENLGKSTGEDEEIAREAMEQAALSEAEKNLARKAAEAVKQGSDPASAAAAVAEGGVSSTAVDKNVFLDTEEDEDLSDLEDISEGDD